MPVPGERGVAHAEGVVPCWRVCLAHIAAGLRGEAVSRWCWQAWPGMCLAAGSRYGLAALAVRSAVVSGRLVPALYRGRAGRHLGGKVWMMTDVACFCGCFYSFDGGAGGCPGCGEVAAVAAGPMAAGTERGQQGQPGPVAKGAPARRAGGGLA